MKAVLIGEPARAPAGKRSRRFGPFEGGGNMAIFKTREAAEAFSREDPFILEGLVKSFVIKDWRDSLLPE